MTSITSFDDHWPLRALIDAGANLNLPDRQGRTPLELARMRGYTEMVRMLERAPARR
jgi:ankyrin repeat protein